MRIESYTELADRMVGADVERDKAFEAYQQMFHLQYNLPDNLEDVEWVRKYISPDPHDAIAASIRVLSALFPRINKQPIAPGAKNKARANEEERVLEWNLYNVNKLRRKNLVADFNESALLYGCVVAHVNDLENEIQIGEETNKDTSRFAIARQKSRYTINVYNPRNVHVRNSNLGIEDILLCQERPVHEIFAEWPIDSEGLVSGDPEDIGGEDYTKLVGMSDHTMVRYYDYWNHTQRAIWCIPSEDDAAPFWIMKPTDHGLNFLPWVAMMGGSDLEHEEEHRYHPMLYPLHQSKSWHTHNDIKSLNYSEIIARAGSPRFAEEGPNRAQGRVDYFNPARIAKMPVGNILKEMSPPMIDVALTEADDRISADIQKATVSRLLQGGDIPSGTAYATLNLATQTAIGALKPAKELSENALAEALEIMLLWSAKTGIPLDGYETVDTTEMGRQYSIAPETVDPSAIFITVELTPDIPSDQLRRANTAQMLVGMGYPRTRALQDVGVHDAEKAIEESYFEQLVEHKFQLALEAERNQVYMMQQQQAQLAQMQQQEEAMANAGPQPGPIPGGQGFNPAAGGMSPVGFAPEEDTMKEMVRGEDITGAAMMPPEV